MNPRQTWLVAAFAVAIFFVLFQLRPQRPQASRTPVDIPVVETPVPVPEKTDKPPRRHRLEGRAIQASRYTTQARPAMVLRVQGKYDEAVVELEKILVSGNREIMPDSLYELARLFMVKKDFAAARRTFEKLLQEFPGDENRGNAERALEYIKNYEKFRSEFVSFESDIK